MSKPLWALLSSIDLFSLWMVFLLATGFGAASRKPTAPRSGGWPCRGLLIVLGKVAWAAIF